MASVLSLRLGCILGALLLEVTSSSWASARGPGQGVTGGDRGDQQWAELPTPLGAHRVRAKANGYLNGWTANSHARKDVSGHRSRLCGGDRTSNQTRGAAHPLMTLEHPASELRAAMGQQGALAKGHSQSADAAPEFRRVWTLGPEWQVGPCEGGVRGQLPAFGTSGSTTPLRASVYPSRCVLGTGEMREVALSKVGDGETEAVASLAWPITHGNRALSDAASLPGPCGAATFPACLSRCHLFLIFCFEKFQTL